MYPADRVADVPGETDRYRRTGEVRGIATEFPLSAHQTAIRSTAEQGGGGSQSLIPVGRPTTQGLTRRFFFGTADI